MSEQTSQIVCKTQSSDSLWDQSMFGNDASAEGTDSKSESSDSLTHRVKNHAGTKRHACTYCSLTFNCSANLTDHIRVHTGEKPFKCQLCEKAFKRASHLTRHKQIHERNKEIEILKPMIPEECVDTSGGKTQLICQLCNRRFEKPSAFIKHTQRHTVEHQEKHGLHGSLHGLAGCQITGVLKDSFECVQEPESVDNCQNEECKTLVFTVKRQPVNDVTDNNISSDSPSECDLGSKQSQSKICRDCGQRFTLMSSLTRHLKIHSGEKPYKCKYCSMTFSLLAYVRRHERSHTGERAFRCGECDKRFGTSSNLVAHMRIHSGEKPFVCLVCGSQFAYNSTLQHHIKSHANESLINSDEPGHDIAMDVKTEPVELQEETCLSGGRLSGKPRSDLAQQQSDCNEQLLGCAAVLSDVSSILTTSTVTQTHCQQPHASRLCMSKNEMDHTCLECGQKFTLLSSLRRHLKIHTGAKPYECRYCAKSFPLLEYLRDHERTHKAEKPYSCKHCDKKFSKSRRLLYHLRIHTGEKPYACKFCGKSFVQPSHLDVHLRTHTGEKRFKCGECGKRFSQSSNLMTHMRVHTGDQRHECVVCCQRFVNARALRSHVRVHAEEDSAIEQRTALDRCDMTSPDNLIR